MKWNVRIVQGIVAGEKLKLYIFLIIVTGTDIL